MQHVVVQVNCSLGIVDQVRRRRQKPTILKVCCTSQPDVVRSTADADLGIGIATDTLDRRKERFNGSQDELVSHQFDLDRTIASKTFLHPPKSKVQRQ